MVKQNSPLRNLLWIFLFSLLFSSCSGVGGNENITSNVFTEQSTSIPTETIAPTATITPTPEPAYALCPDIENFRECYVPEKELLDGSYYRWLKDEVAPTLLEEFKAREDQIRDDIPMKIIGLGTGLVFFYPNEGVYVDEERTAPWNRKVTFAVTSCKHRDGRTLECLVLPVFY